MRLFADIKCEWCMKLMAYKSSHLGTIFPLYYFGNISYWKTLVVSEGVSFSSSHPVSKKTYANRTVIQMANGLQTLSVPLVGGRGSKLPMDMLEVSYTENWNIKHKMALKSAYSKSPFYEYYMPNFERILDERIPSLHELNVEILREIVRILKFKLELDFTDLPASVEFQPNRFDVLLEEYPQVFRYKFPFFSDLSILDLIFNLGPRSLNYLKG